MHPMHPLTGILGIGPFISSTSPTPKLPMCFDMTPFFSYTCSSSGLHGLHGGTGRASPGSPIKLPTQNCKAPDLGSGGWMGSGMGAAAHVQRPAGRPAENRKGKKQKGRSRRRRSGTALPVLAGAGVPPTFTRAAQWADVRAVLHPSVLVLAHLAHSVAEAFQGCVLQP
jgi:hypothetical protein